MNLSNLIINNASYKPDFQAVICGEEGSALSWSELDDYVNKLGNALISLGIQKGDVVAMCMPNEPVCIGTFFAIARIGGIVLPIAASTRISEIEYMLEDSKAKLLIVSSSDIDERLLLMQQRLSNMKNIISFGENLNATLGLHALVEGFSTTLKVVKSCAEDGVALVYAPAVSQQLKGVKLSHADLMFMAALSSSALQISHNDRFVTGTPFCDISFALSVLGPFNAGAGVVTMKRFSPEKALELISKYNVTHFSGTSGMYMFMLQRYNPERYNLESLRFTHCSGGPMPADYIEEIEDTFGSQFSELYEPIEPGTLSSCNRLNGERSYGKLANGIWVKIVDDLGKNLPPGEVGDIWIRSTASNRGHMKKRHSAIFRTEWYRTGNKGMCDKDGYFYIVN
jgi:long-chain acyl-CoA synthetase